MSRRGGVGWKPLETAAVAIGLSVACGDGRSAEVASTRDPETGGDGGQVAKLDVGSEPGSCGGGWFQVERQPRRLVFVVERSRAMVDHTFDHDDDLQTPGVTPWRAAWELMHALLPNWPGTGPCCSWPYFGLVLAATADTAPIPSADACASPTLPNVTIGWDREASVLQSLPALDAGPDDLVGASPMVDAYDLAVQQLLQEPNSFDPRIVLLMHTPPNCTEGAPNSEVEFETLDVRLIDRVAAARAEHDIGTHVVALGVEEGISPQLDDGRPDGIDAVMYFTALAEAGGFPQGIGESAYVSNVDEALELATCLVCIPSCVLPLDPPPPDIDLVEVTIDGDAVPRVHDCSAEDGWVPITQDTIELCGSACDEFHADPKPGPPPDLGPLIEFTFGCP